jgi:hypothetical protein
LLGANIFSFNDKVFLVSRTSAIKDKHCYIDLFKLLIKEKIKYSKNSNGIFFDVGLLSDDVLNNIDVILKFYEIKREKVSNNNVY